MEFFKIFLTIVCTLNFYQALGARGVCERSFVLEHGSILMRPRNVIRFRCNRGYTLKGLSVGICDRIGRLQGERPFCAKEGCSQLEKPENGELLSSDGQRAMIVCKDGYVVVGNRVAFCDGESWNTQLGKCLTSNHTKDHSCDFESEDQCGWEAEVGFRQPWKRISTVNDFHSLRTGPHHDHTFRNTSGGHYMRMETQTGAYGSYHFISPVYSRSLSLKTACCFRFHYFMYGAGVGSLVVSVKPVTISTKDMWNKFKAKYSKFEISGSQGREWIEHTITIDEMESDFEVIFTATDAITRFGDIAIDDVKLMTGQDCGMGDITTTTEPPAPVPEISEQPVVYDMMNCTKRCGQIMLPGMDHVGPDGNYIKGCGCSEECLAYENCCPDYFEQCVLTDTTPEAAEPTTPTTTTTTSTTPNPTTTTRRTTTTTKRTTTTTRKTTTSTKRTTTPTTTTTTTTTTKRTTTPTTTTTTTSTQKPTTTTTTTQKTTTTTTKKPTTTSTTPPTRAKNTPTTTSTTTTTDKTTIIKINTTTTAPVKITIPNNRITWKVDPDDIAGHMDVKENIPNPALVMLFLLIGVVLVVVLINLIKRWSNPISGYHNEKAVSFKKAFDRIRKPTTLLGQRQRNSLQEPLCSSDNENSEDDTRLDEMGVDIRNVSEL
ncbi:uncharacterized protein Dana_GF20691, isoform C [Drosophila ananassae]|uniref:Uncharacterized protein, isoform C n=1 Tax=Drosophila ananassae TaxID=7217 RepID=B3MUD6_DROAN|nr:uncharacterized protein LOC6503386 isoform X2 [Drosophila ananassae]EDV33465.2 uncharacterized protein Dana_GF20691, isoform C [Drosophila ananassae]